MRRQALAMLVASAAAFAAAGLDAAPVSAECPYLPPWPPITTAIPSAREIVVGEIVIAFDREDLHAAPGGAVPDFALRVTHVLRGKEEVRSLLDVQYLLPNWPQTRVAGVGTLTSCTYLPVAPGEIVALALDALQPGGPMRDGGVRWVQPPTRYNAVGVITWTVQGQEGNDIWEGRERVTLAQLRALASLPPTDAAPVPGRNGAGLLFVVGLVAVLLGYWRFRVSGGV